MSVTGYLALLTTQVLCEEFSQCYDDANICLWTDGRNLTWSEAQTVCQQRNSFLPRVTIVTGDRLRSFRSAAPWNLGIRDVWIDAKSVDSNNWHWIDGSPLAGLCLIQYDGNIVYM